MKTKILFALMFSATVLPAFAKPKAAQMATPTATVEAFTFQTPLDATSSRTFTSTVGLDYSNGTVDSLVDLSFLRQIDETDVSAVGTIRVHKSLSSSDGVESIEVREANISLSEPWFEARAGRMDLSELVSTTHFFGRYPLMGARRLDGVKVYIPFKFAFGLEDEKGLASPPTSLSFFYFPSLLSAGNALLDGSQGYFMGQTRMKLGFGKDLSGTLLLNLGEASSDYFTYSSLGGNPSYSICGEADFTGNYKLYFEYGVQNPIRETNAFTFGAKVEHLFSWEFLSLEEVTFESQIPLTADPNNPFTGGNGINHAMASLPQMAWYGSARLKIRSIVFDFSITNSMSDYTLARLNTGNTNSSLVLPVGPGNETDGLELPLSSTGYLNPAFSISMEVPF